jgi:xanthine dehydrogenase accessory factor
MLCVDDAANITGTLGGGCVEADVRRRAHRLLSSKRGELLTFRLDNDLGHDDGMICGGHMEVAVAVLSGAEQAQELREVLARLRAGQPASLPLKIEDPSGPVEYRVHIESTPQLLIAGAGHIARVLAGLSVTLGFRVSVIDDRSRFANGNRFPPPINPVVGDIAGTLREWSIDTDTYVVIVTRGHIHDQEALAAVLDTPARYIGMIGSNRKIEAVYDDLRHAGASQTSLGRVHAPIGVRLGAVTTEEIALSIAAELVLTRRKLRHRKVEGPVPLIGDRQ